MTRRPGKIAAWLAAAILVVVYALVVWWGGPDDSPPDELPAPTHLQIVDLQPTSPRPGAALIVRFAPPTAKGAAAEASALQLLVRDHTLDPIEQDRDEVVFRLPKELATGRAELVLARGAERSPAKEIEIDTVSQRKIVRNVLGGLGLVILGLFMLTKALRRRAGRTLRRQVDSLTASTPRSFGVGALVGGLTQSSTFTAALGLPFVERNLMSFQAALTLLLGAHLGAAAIGSVLPLAGTKDAPLILMVGVILRLAAVDRRERASANLVMGLGVLLHGVYTLRTGFAPLAELPAMLELRQLDPATLTGLALAASIGALGGLAMQGAGVMFVVVLSVAQATSLLTLPQALALLAGVPLGSALSSMLVSWPLGRSARRLGIAHAAVALVMISISWLVLPWLPDLTAAALRTDPEATSYGKKLLHPEVGGHLALGFVTMQLVATAAVVPLVSWISARLQPQHARVQAGRKAQPLSWVEVLASYTRALDSIHRALLGMPGAPAEVDGHLAKARAMIERHVGREPEVHDSDHADMLVSLLALQHAMEHIGFTAARIHRRGIHLGGEHSELIEALHQAVARGLEVAQILVAHGAGPDLDELRTAEIRTNSLEANLREAAAREVAEREVADARQALLFAELGSGYEVVANQLYRLNMSLVPEEEF
ncbi:Na-cotransporter [Enhygromyxa salina]|uniref:Na-cotransporter n=1 Tax=Enhygromyxa salina TaxID=215803 RepID=A0A2S9YL90_9BACT|nr:Na/Pi symporter [Enhygromyxa salina]PRQ05880.1 Na-cotransporter [Enhygromyxa salina]